MEERPSEPDLGCHVDNKTLHGGLFASNEVRYNYLCK